MALLSDDAQRRKARAELRPADQCALRNRANPAPAVHHPAADDSPTAETAEPAGAAPARPPVVLNARWRVRCDDPLQWILEYRRGAGDAKSTGWHARRFHVERDALLRSVRDLCGEVAPSALAALAAFRSRFGGGHEP